MQAKQVKIQAVTGLGGRSVDVRCTIAHMHVERCETFRPDGGQIGGGSAVELSSKADLWAFQAASARHFGAWLGVSRSLGHEETGDPDPIEMHVRSG